MLQRKEQGDLKKDNNNNNTNNDDDKLLIGILSHSCSDV